MCDLIFRTTFARNISHSKKNWARYDEKYILICRRSTRYSYQALIKCGFSPLVFGN